MAVSDTNFIYILSASECQQRNDEEHFKPNKTPNKKSHKLLGHVTKAAGIEVIFFMYFWSPKTRARSREQVVYLTIVPENQDRSNSAP